MSFVHKLVLLLSLHNLKMNQIDILWNQAIEKISQIFRYEIYYKADRLWKSNTEEPVLYEWNMFWNSTSLAFYRIYLSSRNPRLYSKFLKVLLKCFKKSVNTEWMILSYLEKKTFFKGHVKVLYQNILFVNAEKVQTFKSKFCNMPRVLFVYSLVVHQVQK